jgi:hypothetical protein
VQVPQTPSVVAVSPLLFDKPWFRNWGKTCCYTHHTFLLGFPTGWLITTHKDACCTSTSLASSGAARIAAAELVFSAAIRARRRRFAAVRRSLTLNFKPASSWWAAASSPLLSVLPWPAMRASGRRAKHTCRRGLVNGRPGLASVACWRGLRSTGQSLWVKKTLVQKDPAP